jgi:hypothetical protein
MGLATVDLVQRFVETTRVSIRQLTASLRWQPTQIRGVVEMTWDGTVPRQGELGGIEYLVHGRIGCRMITGEGVTVDVEVKENGELEFDTWRVGTFAKSLGINPPSNKDVTKACQSLAKTGRLRILSDDSFAFTPE